MKTAILAGLASAALGALAGWDLDLLRATASPTGVEVGAMAGLLFGLLIGFWQGRSDAAAGRTTPRYAWVTALGIGCLALSEFSFVASQRVPGLRPLIVASAAISLNEAGPVRLSFTPDTTGDFAVFLAAIEDPAAKAARELGLKKGSGPVMAPPKESVSWSAEPHGSAQPGRTVDAFDPSPSRVSLGTLRAEEGRTYELTFTVLRPFVGAPRTEVQVHRSTADWGRAFPRMLAAGALGLFSGIAGMMLVVWGALQRAIARRATTVSL